MNLHPIFVHFPIALFTLYSLLEITKRWQRKEFFYVRACFVLLGVFFGIFAFISGTMLEDQYEDTPLEEAMEMHEVFALTTLIVYGIVALVYLLKWLDVRKTKALVSFFEQKYILFMLALLGLFLITITGALGGGMAYGKTVDPVVELVYSILF